MTREMESPDSGADGRPSRGAVSVCTETTADASSGSSRVASDESSGLLLTSGCCGNKAVDSMVVSVVEGVKQAEDDKATPGLAEGQS